VSADLFASDFFALILCLVCVSLLSRCVGFLSRRMTRLFERRQLSTARAAKAHRLASTDRRIVLDSRHVSRQRRGDSSENTALSGKTAKEPKNTRPLSREHLARYVWRRSREISI